MKIVKRIQTFRPKCQSSWLAWPVNWSRTTLTDIAIEKSFRIIYDSSTARGCRRFPIAPFRLTTRIHDSMRNQSPPRKTIRMNVPNYPPALALVPRCLMQAHRFHPNPLTFFSLVRDIQGYPERLRKFYEWWQPCGENRVWPPCENRKPSLCYQNHCTRVTIKVTGYATIVDLGISW